MNDNRKKQILNNLEIDELKEFIGFYDKDKQDDILKHIDKDKANIIRDLLIYSNDLAPSIMTTEYLSVNVNSSVKEVTSYIFNNANDDILIDNIYVVDNDNKLVGILFLKDVIVARANESITDLMITDLHYAYNDSTIKEAIQIVKITIFHQSQ